MNTSTRIRTPLTVLAGAALALAPVVAANAQPSADLARPGQAASAPAEIGYTGWDTYRHLDELWQLTTGVDSKQFSSFDRAGENWQDGFDGIYSCLRETEQGCVIAEAAGAGEIQSIWFTRDGGDVSRSGHIIIELDGQTVLDAPIQDVVNGDLGAPFVFPFVANADETSGGVTMKVPMTYRESMRVTMENNPLFHHVSYRTFATVEGIDTFDAADVPTDIMAASETWGTADPKPEPDEPSTHTVAESLPAGESLTLATVSGSGYIDEIALDLSQIVGSPEQETVQDDGRAHMGTSQFDVAIDPDNEGVALTRRYDSISTDQIANIYIDGVLAGEWPAYNAPPGQWAEQTVVIPAEFTAGKSTIEVRNEFVSAGMDMSEFHYWVDSVVAGENVRTDELDVGPWEESRASEAAHNYVITEQKWEGDRLYALPVELSEEELALISTSDEILTGLRVRATFDGQTTVDSPLGEFFGSGLDAADVRALMYHMTPEGHFASWWAMPYAQSAVVELVNTSDVDVELVESTVVSAADETIAPRLTAKYPSIGYFNATSHLGDTTDGTDWLFLDVEAQGRFLGVNHTMHGYLSEGNTRGYLEGDERIYVDGLRTPQWHGTGSEDFYEGGWYFNRGTFSNPMNGNPSAEFSAFGCENNCDAAYRLLIGDAIDFGAEMVAGIEHGGFNTDPGLYGSTAFWYGHDGAPRMFETDYIDVGDVKSEEQHGYVGGGDVTTLSSAFEGNHDETIVEQDLRATNDEVSFTVDIDKDNAGVQLQRMSDQNEPYQAAEVYVDGTLVGTWLQPLHNTMDRWLDDSFDLPRSVTKGKKEITVTLVPVVDSAPWTAASYRVMSHAEKARGGGGNSTTDTGNSGNQGSTNGNPGNGKPKVEEYTENGASGYVVTAPGYTVMIQTEPRTAIVSMTANDGKDSVPVLDTDYRSTLPFLGVGGFGVTDGPGVPGSVDVTKDSLTLLDIPMGDEPVTADWTFTFDRHWFDTTLSYEVTGATTAPVWEMSLSVDTALAPIGDNEVADRPTEDANGFPQWIQGEGEGVGFAAAYLEGSANPTDNRYYYPPGGTIVIQPEWQFFGADIPVGTVDVGTWRFGTSMEGTAAELGQSLYDGLNG